MISIGRSLSLLLAVAALTTPVEAANLLLWNKNRNTVTADIQSGSLPGLLNRVAAHTGWQVYVEPNTTHIVSAKFRDLPPGDALPLLLGKLNFALLPGTNSKPRLLVFRTGMGNATEHVRGVTNLIPNQLVVRLAGGTNITEFAEKLGAKVTGRIDELGVYRLEFKDEAAAESGRALLAQMDGISAVENNFAVERPGGPPPAQTSGTPPPPQLQLKPPPENGRVILGLIDTAIQPLGNDLDKFFLKSISVAGDAAPPGDGPSHATSMAETMLRSLQIATDGSTSVQILPVDVYGPNPNTSTFDVANGIVQAVNAGARVINMSLGSESESLMLRQILDDAARQNITVFAAAGNEPVTTPYYPAAYPGVMAVTAFDQGQIAPYANRGSFVSLAGPGTSIIHYGDQAYYVVGTSAASAFVSGVAAGYMDATGNTPAEMRMFLTNTFGVRLGP